MFVIWTANCVKTLQKYKKKYLKKIKHQVRKYYIILWWQISYSPVSYKSLEFWASLNKTGKLQIYVFWKDGKLGKSLWFMKLIEKNIFN